MIQLRFGYYGGREEANVHSLGDIAKLLGMKRLTVYQLCRRYIANDYNLIRNPWLKHNKSYVSKPQLKELNDLSTLYWMRTKNLSQRSHWIMENWGVRIPPKALSRIYRQHRNSFTKAHYHWNLRMPREVKLA